MDWTGLLLLAQDAVDAAGEPAPPPLTGPSLTAWLFPLTLIVMIFYLLIWLPERKRVREKKQLLDSIKKNDRVLTVGGLYGVVANVKPGDDEIVLRIDEDKDVKIRVTKSSISQVFSSSKQD
jgi:preprotein translocase subunit YajC